MVALVEICKLDEETAYNIMHEAHEKGKTSAKTGDYDEITTMQKQLNDREINATVEEL